MGIILESHVRKRKSARRKGKAWGFFGKFVYSSPPFIRLISYNPLFRKRKKKNSEQEKLKKNSAI